MINVNALPCQMCVYFGGVKQKGDKEEGEIVFCKKSKSGSASENIFESHGKIKCDIFKEGE